MTRTSTRSYQQVLAGLWFIASAIGMVILTVQSIDGKYAPRTKAAWEWFLPLVLPTVTVILGVVLYDTRQRKAEQRVSSFAFWVSFSISLVYLVLLLLTLFLQQFANMKPIELMEMSRLWLIPMQGLVGISLGLVFASRQVPMSRSN
jgi:hypothetical protein